MYARIGDAVGDAVSNLRATYMPRNRYEIVLNFLLTTISFWAMQPVLQHDINNGLASVFLASSVAIIFFLITIASFTAFLIISILAYNLISCSGEALDLRALNGLRRSWFLVLTFIILGAVSATIPHLVR